MKIQKKTIILSAAFLVLAITSFQVVKNEFSPAELNREDNVTVIVPKAEVLPKQEIIPMRVDKFEFHNLGEGTDTGNPGDILQTISGQGFYYTSRSPRLLFGKEYIVENTEVNKAGTELYVILSKEVLENFQKLDFKQVVVFMGDDPKAKGVATFQISPDSYADIKAEKTVVLKYQRGYFIRE
ncbi:hypothetical protein [uncultured Eudoraea sp.]|uniref:hypothetical protein n=1 Tax=uncultured Eudoraea sp. TaxID=1035614 RepID=UPI00261D56F7|nr:hypothetical protein [uncultured Eudoraea sp.]